MYITIQLYTTVNRPVREVFGLFLGADELDDGVEELLALVPLLLLEHEHEVVVEARLHHHPVDCTRQVDVRGQEDDVFALQRRDALVLLHEVRHHLLETALPLARCARTRAVIWPAFKKYNKLYKAHVHVLSHSDRQ